MATPKIQIVIPSRGRAKIGTTWKLYPEALVLVHEREAPAYEAEGVCPPRLMTHTVEGGLTPTRNWILDHAEEDSWTVQMDDDITVAGRFSPTKAGTVVSVRMDPAAHWAELTRQITAAHEKGFHLLGVSCNANAFYHRPSRPISYGTFIAGHFMACRVRRGLRFDENCFMRQDYDYTLQVDTLGLGVLRLDYLWFEHDYRKMAGGCQETRTREKEIATNEYLMAKWPGRLCRKHKANGSVGEFRIVPNKRQR